LYGQDRFLLIVVKRDEDALRMPEEQIAEHRPTIIIHASNRDVEDRSSLQKERLAAPSPVCARTCIAKKKRSIVGWLLGLVHDHSFHFLFPTTSAADE